MTTDITADYHILHNLDARFGRPYRQGDRLANGHTGQVTAVDPAHFADLVFAIHNRDDRPDGKTAPSLSVGDVIIVGETAVSVDRMGFVNVCIAAADLLGRPWLEARR